MAMDRLDAASLVPLLWYGCMTGPVVGGPGWVFGVIGGGAIVAVRAGRRPCWAAARSVRPTST